MARNWRSTFPMSPDVNMGTANCGKTRNGDFCVFPELCFDSCILGGMMPVPTFPSGLQRLQDLGRGQGRRLRQLQYILT